MFSYQAGPRWHTYSFYGQTHKLVQLQAHMLTQHIGLGYLVHSAMPGTSKMKALAPVKQTAGTVIN